MVNGLTCFQGEVVIAILHISVSRLQDHSVLSFEGAVLSCRQSEQKVIWQKFDLHLFFTCSRLVAGAKITLGKNISCV